MGVYLRCIYSTFWKGVDMVIATSRVLRDLGFRIVLG